ncbi:hypothetical protein H4219_002472 [Mycoemilia scoparia]|uniref:Uncharacterized protein n=1 Tax=Mycoemilia scoparia TaxID=417184 RepID=A0A9W7ZXL1_9FUNG|nr:hypothetical protein H4219_002472 [Mycoemilia scoparia]
MAGKLDDDNNKKGTIIGISVSGVVLLALVIILAHVSSRREKKIAQMKAAAIAERRRTCTCGHRHTVNSNPNGTEQLNNDPPPADSTNVDVELGVVTHASSGKDNSGTQSNTLAQPKPVHLGRPQTSQSI